MKNKLNYELLEFHIREVADELDSLLSRIQFMLGRLDKAGESQVYAWGNLNETGLEVSLAHAYHHMNFAWNVRNKTTKEADGHFDRDEKFPRPTGRFDSFARFWPKSLIKKNKMSLPAMNVPGRSEALMQILDEDSSWMQPLMADVLSHSDILSFKQSLSET